MNTDFFKVYIVAGKEHYVYLYDLEEPDLTAIQEFPFPESLVSMAYLSKEAYEPILTKISSALSRLYKCQAQDAADEISELLSELGKVHIYFEFLRVDWQHGLVRSAQSGYLDVRELLPEEEVPGLMKGITFRQQQVQKLFASVLDMDTPQKKSPCLITLTKTTKPITDFLFHALSFDFEQTEDGEYVEIMRPGNFYDLIDYHLRECLKRKVRMRACKNCGKYFAVIKNAKAEYCNHPFDAKGRSCREIASIIQWNQNRADDQVFKEYRREYKKRFARMKAGTMGEAQFYLWSKQAREKKAECEAGNITLEEFSEWLSQL